MVMDGGIRERSGYRPSPLNPSEIGIDDQQQNLLKRSPCRQGRQIPQWAISPSLPVTQVDSLGDLGDMATRISPPHVAQFL